MVTVRLRAVPTTGVNSRAVPSRENELWRLVPRRTLGDTLRLMDIHRKQDGGDVYGIVHDLDSKHLEKHIRMVSS